MPRRKPIRKQQFGFKCCNPQHTSWGESAIACEQPLILGKIRRAIRYKLFAVAGVPHWPPNWPSSKKLRKESRLCIKCYDHLKRLAEGEHREDHTYFRRITTSNSTVIDDGISPDNSGTNMRSGSQTSSSLMSVSMSAHAVSANSISSHTQQSEDPVEPTELQSASLESSHVQLSAVCVEPTTLQSAPFDRSPHSSERSEQGDEPNESQAAPSHLQIVLTSLQYLTETELAEVGHALGEFYQPLCASCQTRCESPVTTETETPYSPLGFIKIEPKTEPDLS